jgi:ribosome maturation factor RimP
VKGGEVSGVPGTGSATGERNVGKMSTFAPVSRRNEREEGAAPLFYSPAGRSGMITTERLTEALQRHLAGTPHFLVHAEVRPTGKAIVEVDNDKAITLADLTAINESLRDAFGEALDDLELEVGSPGMGRPFRVKRQYVKHTGRMVEVKFTDGRLLTGQLVAANDQGIQLRIEHPSKIKGRAPKLDEEATAFAFAEITSTQAIIKFN